MIYDYKYRPQPDFTDYPNSKRKNNTSSITSILDEIFAPCVKEVISYKDYETCAAAISSDNSTYNVVCELPRLVHNSISVEIEPITTSIYKTSAYKVLIKALKEPLTNYLVEDENKQETAKPFEQQITVLDQPVALDGSLKLSYSEGVLAIEIPLTKPVQPKKQGLSARLSEIES